MKVKFMQLYGKDVIMARDDGTTEIFQVETETERKVIEALCAQYHPTVFVSPVMGVDVIVHFDDSNRRETPGYMARYLDCAPPITKQWSVVKWDDVAKDIANYGVTWLGRADAYSRAELDTITEEGWRAGFQVFEDSGAYDGDLGLYAARDDFDVERWGVELVDGQFWPGGERKPELKFD